MASATDILETMETAADDLESLTSAFKKSIVPPRGGDFDLLQAVWETQKRLSETCKLAATLNGPEADALWKRVGAVRQETQEVLVISKRLHEDWKRQQPSGNGHRADGPEPVVSIPQYLGNGDRPRPVDYVARKAAKSLRDKDIRSRMKGARLSDDSRGQGKKGGRR